MKLKREAQAPGLASGKLLLIFSCAKANRLCGTVLCGVLVWSGTAGLSVLLGGVCIVARMDWSGGQIKAPHPRQDVRILIPTTWGYVGLHSKEELRLLISRV